MEAAAVADAAGRREDHARDRVEDALEPPEPPKP